jgi:hypothetical protein
MFRSRCEVAGLAQPDGAMRSRRLLFVFFAVLVVVIGSVSYALSRPLANWRSTSSLRNEALDLFPLGTSSQVVRRQLLAFGFGDVAEPVDSFGTVEWHSGYAPHLQMYAMRRPMIEIAYLTHSTQFVFMFDLDNKLIDVQVRRYILAL